jgi:hypothetical protein
MSKQPNPFVTPQTDDQGHNHPEAHSLIEARPGEQAEPGLARKLKAHPRKHGHKWNPRHGKGPKAHDRSAHAKLKERVRRRP